MTTQSQGVASSLEQAKLLDCLIMALTVDDHDFVNWPDFGNFVEQLRPHARRMIVCVPDKLDHDEFALTKFCNEHNIEMVEFASRLNGLTLYSKITNKLMQEGFVAEDDVVFCENSLLGPLHPLEKLLCERDNRGLDLLSAFTYHTNADNHFKDYRDQSDTFAEPNWLQVSPALFNSPVFKQTLESCASSRFIGDTTGAEVHFTTELTNADFKVGGYDQGIVTESSSPLWMEADKLVRGGHPFLYRKLLTFDPLMYEMQTIKGRCIVEAIEDTTNFDRSLLWQAILHNSRLRDVATRFEELNLILEQQVPSDRTSKIPRLALISHVYYTDFVYELVEHYQFMPAGSHMMISVASEEGKGVVENVLKKNNVAPFTVKVVEKNRGRDMSSLFITFRDEMLSGDIDLALRLHSKKTPQVAPHVSSSFRSHLIENLIPNENYVEGVVDLFDKNPSIGMAIPPTIHIGFGTLGHAWFANLPGVKKTLKRLKLPVKVDLDTPLAAYGTMFWFRPEALAPMFAEPWQWDEFNAEPNHIDGGLAHIMERLMGYVAQGQGYRVTQIVSGRQLVTNYVKLEYKLQRLAATFPTPDIRKQVRMGEMMFGKGGSIIARTKMRIWNGWVSQRSKIKRNHPELWEKMVPWMKNLRRLFGDKTMDPIFKRRIRRSKR